MKMLIVENSPEMCHRLLSLAAQVDGIDVVGMAHDARTGMLLAKAHRPNLAIVDLHLARDDAGRDIIQGIKDAQPGSNVVALATSTLRLQQRADALASGTDYLLDKSKEFDRLAGLLRLLKNMHQQAHVKH